MRPSVGGSPAAALLGLVVGGGLLAGCYSLYGINVILPSHDLLFEEEPVDFGVVAVGSSSVAVVKAQNFSGVIRQVDAAEVAGSDSFTVADAALPVELDDEEWIELEVTFAPSTAGEQVGQLVLGTDHPDSANGAVRLQGTGE